MRIRTIKPEFWTDSLMVSLPRDVRLFFVGLWNVADDFGYFRDDADQLKLQIFPGDSDIDVSELLEVLIASGRIDRFEDSEGGRFLKIAKWEDHQRVDKPTKSKIAREDSRKLAIPLSTRREVALKYGCTPGGEVSASCYFCGAPGRIVWSKLSSGKPSSWVIFPDLELDHFIPESQSGEGSEGNIVLSCRFCNRSRGNKSAIEFLANPRESSRVLAPEWKGKEGKGKERKGKEQGKGRVVECFVFPSLEDVQSYCNERGYKFFDCALYHKLRTANDWVNAKGRKISNWKNDVNTSEVYGGFRRQKTAEEIEREQMEEFAKQCAKDVMAG